MKVMTQSLALAAVAIAILLASTVVVDGGAVDCVLSASPSQGLTTNCKEMADLNSKTGATSLYCPTQADCISIFGESSGSSSTSKLIVETSAEQNNQVAGIEAAVESSASQIAVTNIATNNKLCWSGNEDPATNPDLPFFNSNLSVVCKGLDDYSGLQCGKAYYGKDDNSFLNWVHGTKHPRFPNWIAMDKVGKSQYAPAGLMFGTFKLGMPGSLRDPHWHPNSSEILFVTGGKARVSVTGGFPKTDVAGNLRGATSTVEGKERFSETFLVSPGDAVIFPVGYHHYFEGIDADVPLRGIAIFDTPDLKLFDTPQVMKNVPNSILNRVLSLNEGVADGFYTGSRRVITDPNPTWSPPDSNDLADNSLFKVSSIYNDLVPALRQKTQPQKLSMLIQIRFLAKLVIVLPTLRSNQVPQLNHTGWMTLMRSYLSLKVTALM